MLAEAIHPIAMIATAGIAKPLEVLAMQPKYQIFRLHCRKLAERGREQVLIRFLVVLRH